MEDILVASVSGGHFPYQLAALVELTKYNYKPSISIGGSGGTVAIYCASAAEWVPNKLIRISRSLCSGLFIEKRSSHETDYLPSAVSAYYHGALYMSSTQSQLLLDTYFTCKTVMYDEVWVAAVNEGDASIALFCNRSHDRAVIKGEYLDIKMCRYEPIRYCDGDLKTISKSITASSCIPMFIEPIVIDDKPYVDCGVKYGSPLTPLFNEIKAISRKQGVHITYLAGYDTKSMPNIDNNIREYKANIFHHLKTLPSFTVRSLVEQDKWRAHDIISDRCDTEPMCREFNIEELEDALNLKQYCKTSLLEIYPMCEDSINVFDFNGDDVVKFIKNSTKKLGIRMWYVPK